MDNDFFDEINNYTQQIIEEQYQKGLQEGTQKVDNNVYNSGFNQGQNVGQLYGTIIGEIKIISIIDKENKFKDKLQQINDDLQQLDLKELTIATTMIQMKLKLNQIKKQLNLQGGLQFKRVQQTLDF
ncbi:hypothetical protein pb186bvf_004521 [Paramecium bursaria]